MMFGLGSLVVHLAANTAAFSRDLGKAAHEADRRMKSIGDAAEKAGRLMGAALLAGAGTMAVLVKQAINGADSMSKLSQGAGLATAAFSEYAYGARLSGVSTEQFSTSITRLNRNISDAAAGTGEARMAFAALGIELKNTDGSLKNADATMNEVADKFAAMEDGAGKSALAVMLFGRAGAAMIPMLNQGSEGMARMRDEARQLGLTIDTETGRAAEQFNDNLTRLNAAKQGVANTIMRALLPQMNAFTDALVEGAKDGDKFNGIAKAAVTLFQTLAVVGSDVAFVFRMIGGEIGVWAAQIAALARGDFAGFKLIGKEWTEDAARARAELDAFQQRVMALGTAAQTTGAALDTAVRKVKAPLVQGADAAKKAADDSERARRAMAEAINREYENAINWIQSGQEAERKAAEARQAWIDNWSEGMDSTSVKLQQQKSLVEELGLTFTSAFEDAVVSGNGFRAVLDGILKDILRIMVRKNVTEPLGQGITAWASGFFGGTAAPAGPGAYMGTVPAFAEGSDYVPRTGLALVHQGERIIPASENRAAMAQGERAGGVTVHQVNHFSVGSPAAARDVVLQMMPMVIQSTKQAVFDARQRGAGA